MISDPSPHRVSACPVHFLWDGRGRARVLVRGGFLGFIIAAMLLTLGRMTNTSNVTQAGVSVVVVAGALWALGQLGSAVVARRSSSRNRTA